MLLVLHQPQQRRAGLDAQAIVVVLGVAPESEVEGEGWTGAATSHPPGASHHSHLGARESPQWGDTFHSQDLLTTGCKNVLGAVLSSEHIQIHMRLIPTLCRSLDRRGNGGREKCSALLEVMR